ncbi:MAG: hypothetical protein IJ759_03945 [Bacteroidales bacterium]|nr:hypothetical protein [Bacteroidales bacterium]
MKQKLLDIIKNPKTRYILVFILFVLLMCFSKEKNIFYYHHLTKQKKELEYRKSFYLDEIQKDSTNTSIIQKDLDAAEKYGREQYLMKRDNEDIFIIRHAEDSLIKNTIK